MTTGKYIKISIYLGIKTLLVNEGYFIKHYHVVIQFKTSIGMRELYEMRSRRSALNGGLGDTAHNDVYIWIMLLDTSWPEFELTKRHLGKCGKVQFVNGSISWRWEEIF